jgi:hypothetical protein
MPAFCPCGGRRVVPPRDLADRSGEVHSGWSQGLTAPAYDRAMEYITDLDRAAPASEIRPLGHFGP